jgi:hypothetical protein
VPDATGTGDLQRQALRSPVWSGALAKVISRVSVAVPTGGEVDDLAIDSALATIGGVDPDFLQALEHRGAADRAARSEEVCGAGELLAAVATLWARHARADRGAALARLLSESLSAHEASVLAGELTYAVPDTGAGEPAARLSELAASLPAREVPRCDLLTIQEASLELGALKVRTAGNIATGGRGGGAPEARSWRVDQLVRTISSEVSKAAVERVREVPGGRDAAALHLGSGLRLIGDASTGREFASLPAAGLRSRPGSRHLRGAWLDLAKLECAAVAALDRDQDDPVYEERFGDLKTAIVEGAANVLYGARLVSRPHAFRHRRAWEAQASMLSYAMEAYVEGLRDVPEGFSRAQLIILTRLVRAVAAIVLIDLLGSTTLSGNGDERSEPD